MNYSMWFGNLAAYSLQIAVLVLAGTLAWGLLRVKQARLTLGFWQVLLAACLLLPLLEPWERMSAPSARGYVSTAIRIAMVGAESKTASLPVYRWILFILAAGIGLGFLRLVLGLWRLADYRRTARRIENLPGPLREARALVGAESAFFLSARLEVPVTFGWRRPTVVFPARFEEMAESHQRAIACHELLHVARRDWLQNLVEELVLTVLWFHPAVWWVVRNIRLSREQVVDREVVKLTGARQSYLHALLEIAGAAQALPLPAPLFLGESQLVQRVALLVKEVRMSNFRLMASLVAALATLGVAGALVARALPLTAPGLTPPAMISPPSGVPAQVADSANRTTKTGTGKVYKVGGDVTAPVPIFKPEPPYSEAARKDKIQGTILLAVVVDAQGNVKKVHVDVPLRPDLDANAVKAVRTWKFKPATRKGKPVPVDLSVEVMFRLF